MRFFLGIEGIGVRGSFAAMADARGNVLAWVSGGGLRIWGEVECFRTTFFQTICKLTDAAGLKLSSLKETVLCAGLSEGNTPYDRLYALPEIVEQCDLEFASPPLFTGDGEITLASHALTNTGMVVICNGGFNIYFGEDGQGVSFGGWGPRLGGIGSGHSIGRAAVFSLCHEWAAKRTESQLWTAVDAWLEHPPNALDELRLPSAKWKLAKDALTRRGEDPRAALFHFSRSLSAPEWDLVVSLLSEPLIIAADAGDASAMVIVNASENAIAEGFHAALQVAHDTIRKGPIVFYGSLFSEHRSFRDRIVSRVLSCLEMPPSAVFSEQRHSMRPAFGALLLALGGSTSQQNRLPSDSVCNTLRDAVVSLSAKGECVND